MRGLRRPNGQLSTYYMPLILTLVIFFSPRQVSVKVYDAFSSIIWKMRLSSMESFPHSHSLNTKKDGDEQLIQRSEEASLQEWQIQEGSMKKQEERKTEEALKQIQSTVKLPFKPLIGSVIYQESPPYGTALWINIGKKNVFQEQKTGESGITDSTQFPLEKNCPVICQGTLVGCIDYVGDYASRVILLSDPKLAVSAQVKRSLDARKRAEAIEAGLAFRKALQVYSQTANQKKSQSMEKALKAVDTIVLLLEKSTKDQTSTKDILFLAKGQLRGSKSKEKPILIDGVGFTCDFEDIFSTKRDLRTGQAHPHDERIAIVKPGDILETTGLDGVFPRGLPVALVKEVLPLVEGATSYTIKASPLLHSFPSFEYLSVLPRLPREIDKTPSQVERILSLLEEEATLAQSE